MSGRSCAGNIRPLRNLLAALRYHREEFPDPTPVNINGIIEQTLQGDRQAYARLIERYQDGVFAFLWRMGLRRAVIEELAQETFVRAWTHLGDFQPARSAFSTWLFAIGRNLALNEIGRAGHRLEVATADDDAEPASGDDTPLAALERKRSRARLHTGLSRLAAAQRSVLALCYLNELSLAEVAAIEGISIGATKVRLHRARQALRDVLENLP